MPIDVDIALKTRRTASGAALPVLRDLRFRASDGEVAALIGPSGCGKSTLLRILAGLDRDFAGRIEMPDGPIGMAFQEPRLLPWRSVEDNIRLAAPNLSDAERLDLFERLGLAEHRAHFPGELSVGLARRVALARAFAVEPSVLLLDEPFVSLDAPLARQLRRELQTLVEARRVTTLLVTHGLEEAVSLADVVFVLSARPARVLGEVRIDAPRSGLTEDRRRAFEARVEALRGGMGS